MQCWLQVLGMGEEWRGGDVARYPGGGHKINILKKETELHKNESNLVLMFVDRWSHQLTLLLPISELYMYPVPSLFKLWTNHTNVFFSNLCHCCEIFAVFFHFGIILVMIWIFHSYDLILLGGPQAFLKKFLEFKANMVFSAEGFCWPDKWLKASAASSAFVSCFSLSVKGNHFIKTVDSKVK